MSEATRKFAVIGDPVGQSLSPDLHNRVFGQLDIAASYGKRHVSPENLVSVVAGFRSELDGFNITVPHKTAIIPCLDEISAAAETIGAVNCVQVVAGKLIGHNTDHTGFSRLLEKNKITNAESPVLVLGAGGAARAVVYALLERGFEAIAIVNRTPERAREMVVWAGRLGKSANLQAATIADLDRLLTAARLVINCTPLGMTSHGGGNPLGDLSVSANQILIDTIYTPLETEFLRTGRLAGARTVNGLEMFIYQGLAALDIWLGKNISGRIYGRDLKDFLSNRLKNVK